MPLSSQKRMASRQEISLVIYWLKSRVLKFLQKGDNVHITIITMLGTVSYFNLILRREIKSAPAPNPNQDTRIYKTYLGVVDACPQCLGDPAREHFPGFAMPFRTAAWPPSSSLACCRKPPNCTRISLWRGALIP